HLFTNESRTAFVRSSDIRLPHVSAFLAVAAAQSTNPPSRMCHVALSIRRWRQIPPAWGKIRIEPLSSSCLLSCADADADADADEEAGPEISARTSIRKCINANNKARSPQAAKARL